MSVMFEARMIARSSLGSTSSIPSLAEIDQSIFENSNTTPASKLPVATSVSLHSKSFPRGQPEWVGGSQHLKHLSKTVGAKVNDFLRRKEPTSHSSFGVTEVNESAKTALSCGQEPLLGSQNQEEGQAPVDAIPRLSPPPEVAKKRTPRALKTTQDMLIASQPLLSSMQASFAEGRQEHACPPTRTEAAQSEIGSLTQEVGISPTKAFDVPDLIHKENLELKLSNAYRISPSLYPESVSFRLNVSAGKSLGSSKAKTSTLENEGHSPDLLSFE
ncbi:uncharacterized protein C1orf226 homolog [Rhineura floridana]|uniref:uncharacterized protein C1orf226 homolog n=1 Tax=Rhineura floridana TaxID=261503 RepID=UPI002AC8092E|nr:uncharacterized protein C1orf226 homolog [Rhineura floridana]